MCFADVSTRENSSWACSKVFDSMAISSAKPVSQITLAGCRLLRELSRMNSSLLLWTIACVMAEVKVMINKYGTSLKYSS